MGERRRERDGKKETTGRERRKENSTRSIKETCLGERIQERGRAKDGIDVLREVMRNKNKQKKKRLR